MNTLQTADQNNLPQTGQVTISPYDPSEVSKLVAPTRAAVALSREQDLKLELKLPRAQMIEAVRNSIQIPLVWQEVLLAYISMVDAKHDLLRLDFISHAHGQGGNFTGTVKEI